MSELVRSIPHRSHRLLLLFLTLGAVSGCSDQGPKPVRGDSRAKSYPLFSIDMDPQRTMPFDPAQPYRLKFGRGSKQDGLETISIDEEGQVVLVRSAEGTSDDGQPSHWETAQFTIDSATRKQLAELILDLGITDMNLAYDAKVDEGCRWIFWLTQGEKQKSICFNNYFPDVIQDFAVRLDGVLNDAGLTRAKWSPVPAEQDRIDEQDLWASTVH